MFASMTMGRHYVLALKLWRQLGGRTNQIELEDRTSEYKSVWIQAADEIGAELHELNEAIWEVRRGGRRIRIAGYRLPFDDPVTLAVAGHKTLVYSLLKSRNIPVPDHLVFRADDIAAARRFLESYPLGCVVKPVRGFGGKGVTTHISPRSPLRRAAYLASLYSRDLIIEPQIYGESCRILVVKGKVLHAVRRSGIRITGNGRNTLAELFAEQTAVSPEVAAKRLRKDSDTRFCLAHLKLEPEAILENRKTALIKSRREFLSFSYEQRTAYDEDITDALGPALRACAEETARRIGSNLVGVDMITPDVSTSLAEAGGVLNEANTTPALHHHFNQNTALARAVPARLLEILLKGDDQPCLERGVSLSHAAR